MKNSILFLSILLFTQIAFSQITATTSTGRKVTLNYNGHWVYADGMTAGTTESNECEVSKYGKVTFKNNSDKNIFVAIVNDQGFLRYKLKISKFTSKSLDMIPATSYGYSKLKYEYQVFLEEPAENYNYQKDNYKLNGNFFIKICENINFVIDDL